MSGDTIDTHTPTKSKIGPIYFDYEDSNTYIVSIYLAQLNQTSLLPEPFDSGNVQGSKLHTHT